MPDGLIVRLPNWLGDTVMAVPALRALRERFPGARILLAGPWATTLTGQGLADTLVTYPRAWGGRLRTADAVRAFRGDTAVLLPNSLEAALAARYWGARHVVGFATGGRRWLLSDAVAVPDPRRHQVDEYLQLAAVLDARTDEVTPRLAPPAEDSDAWQGGRALVRDAAAGREPVVGMHLGAAFGAAKLWPLARVAEFCRLVDAEGGRVVLLGAPADTAAADEVRRAAPAASLAGRDTPALMPAILAALSALVSGDTGVGHLAAALGTPTVTLFGPTDPALTAPRGRASALTYPVPCAPCFYRTCPIEHPCLHGITPATVLEAIRALAATSPEVRR
jgi:heptosyltransferase-2